MRSALKTYKVDVKYCQLGCFKEKKGKQFIVRTKTWIENADGDLLLVEENRTFRTYRTNR